MRAEAHCFEVVATNSTYIEYIIIERRTRRKSTKYSNQV